MTWQRTFVLGVVLLLTSGAAVAQPVFYAANGFAEHLEMSPNKVRKFPELTAIQPIPPTVEASAIEAWSVGCGTFVRQDDEAGFSGVKRAKVTHQATLYTLDIEDGTFEAFDLGSKTVKSDADGNVGSLFEIPAALFADGFESGDTLVWVVATARFKGGKKANGANLACATSHDRR